MSERARRDPLGLELRAADVDGTTAPEHRARAEAEAAQRPEALEWLVNAGSQVDDKVQVARKVGGHAGIIGANVRVVTPCRTTRSPLRPQMGCHD